MSEQAAWLGTGVTDASGVCEGSGVTLKVELFEIVGEVDVLLEAGSPQYP
jgi:hypothetical protein